MYGAKIRWWIEQNDQQLNMEVDANDELRARGQSRMRGERSEPLRGQDGTPAARNRWCLGVYLRAFALLWQTGGAVALLQGAIGLFQGLAPGAGLWGLKGLTDGLADLVRAPSLAGAPVAGTGLATLLPYLALGVGALVGQQVLRTLSRVTVALLQERVRHNTWLIVLRQASRLDLAFYEDPAFYDKLERARSEQYRLTNLTFTVTGFVPAVVSLVGVVGVLAAVHPLLAAALLAAPVPSIVAELRYSTRYYRLLRERAADQRRMGYLTWLLTWSGATKELKAFRLPPTLLERFRRLSMRFMADVWHLTSRRAATGFALSLPTYLIAAGGLYYAVQQALAGRISVGGLALIVQASMLMPEFLGGVIGTFVQFRESGLFLQNVFEFLDLRPAHEERFGHLPAPADRPGRIELRGVSFRYPGAAHDAVSNVSFTIEPGERIALVGPNGAGKTTLVKLLLGLYEPTAGQVLLDGRPIRDYDRESLRAHFSVVFQDFVKYALTALDNIGVGHVEGLGERQAAQEAAALAGAHEFIERLPRGYDTLLSKMFEGGVELSGGEWQKIALARAFRGRGQVLVLDEPTASLDPEAEEAVFNLLLSSERRTLVLISHRYSTVRRAQRILVMDGGRLVEHGTHESLLTSCGRYARMFRFQMEAS